MTSVLIRTRYIFNKKGLAMRIPVKIKDYGFYSQSEITVQKVDKYDDFDDVVYCNHAGYFQSENFNGYPIDVCDKCSAWRSVTPEGDDEWQDAPIEGER